MLFELDPLAVDPVLADSVEADPVVDVVAGLLLDVGPPDVCPPVDDAFVDEAGGGCAVLPASGVADCGVDAQARTEQGRRDAKSDAARCMHSP